MKYKRAIITGIIIRGSIFMILSILMFLPFLKGKEMSQYILFLILLIPVTLLAAKWYFKIDPPSVKKGFYLGLIVLGVSTLLDVIITVPVFVKSYVNFFGNWRLYIGLSELVLLCVYAGWEFDDTFTAQE